MNAVSNVPLPGLAPQPPATYAAVRPRWDLRRIKDLAVTIYAFAVLGFGLLFPFVLAAWTLLFVPASP